VNKSKVVSFFDPSFETIAKLLQALPFLVILVGLDPFWLRAAM
jgi:hypothetical protein